MFDITTFDVAKTISQSHNRFWFINVVRDRGTPAAITGSNYPDSTYYLLQCDSENVNNYQTGLLLSGSTSGWETLNRIAQS